MNKRATCSLRYCVLPWLLALAVLAILPCPRSTPAAERSMTVNVDPGKTKTQNVGCGFSDLSDAVYELTIEVTSEYEIVDTGIDEQAGSSVAWERDEEDIKKFRITGVDPNKRFWVVIWAKLAPPGEGEGEVIRWMSVSDLDADADTDNNSAVCPRIPSQSDAEDFAEYPGYQSAPTVPGLVIGVNDDHDEFLPGATPWGRDLDNTTADLTKEGKNYGGWSVGLAQIRVKVGVKRAPGSLAFSVPSSVRLFEGELPVGVNKGAAFLGNRTINSAGEQTFVFYAEGKAPYQEPQQLVTSYDPEGPGEGKAEDIVTVLPVRMGIDVDSDNNGTVSSSDDLIEAKPGEIGMIAPMTADPANGKPGKLRGLFSTNVAYLLDNVQTNPVVRLGKISGTTGHVCVWKVRAGQTPVLMLNTSQSSSTTTDGDGNTLFQLLGDATDHDILITGVAPGEVMLGLQLTVNGVKVAMDVVRVTVVSVAFLEDPEHNYGYDKYETMNAVYATHDPPITPGPPYDALSVERNHNTTVLAQVQGIDPLSLAFVSTDTSVFNVVSVVATSDPTQCRIEIQGQDVIKNENEFLEARASLTPASPFLARLRVAVYNRFIPDSVYTLYNVSDSQSPGTDINVNTDGTALAAYMNERFRQAVMSVTLGGSIACDIPFDTSPTNGMLDVVAGSERTCVEVLAILSDTRIATDPNPRLLHVRNLRWSFMFDGNQDPSSGTIQLRVVNALQYVVAGKTFTIEDWSQQPPYRSQITIESINRTTGEIVLRAPFPQSHTFPDASSALIWPLGGLSGDPAFVYSAHDNTPTFQLTVTHELGHSYTPWVDVAPDDNVMHGRLGDNHNKLRFRPLPQFYQEPPNTPDQQQWSVVPRN